MFDNIKVSVIVPVYNVENLVKRCIESIKAQTYKNLEIIIVDDGSLDKSGLICDQLKQTDSRIIVLHQKNQGVSAARNTGIKNATGDLIGFVDPDDWINNDFYSKLVEAYLKYQSDIVIANYNYVDDNESIIKSSGLNFCEYIPGKSAINDLCCEKIHNYVWNKVFHRRLFENILFPEGRIYEDLAIIHKLFYDADKVVHIEYCGYNYYVRSGSLVHNTDKDIDAFEMFQKRYNELCLMDLENADTAKHATLKRCAEYAFRSLHSPGIINYGDSERLYNLRTFWENNKKKIALIDISFFIRVYFPHLFLVIKKIKKLSMRGGNMNKMIENERKLYFSSPKNMLKCYLLKEQEYYLWQYVKTLRKEENSNFIIIKYFYRFKKNILGIKLGINIGAGVFDEGLKIWHYGSIVVNNTARVGKNCRLHGNNCIGNNGSTNKSPVIGNNVDIGFGAQVLGDIVIADNIKIGAGAVVVHSFLEEGITIAGVPAKKVNK